MTSDGAPTISVVVITYNQAQFVGAAITSIVSQDYTGDWEVIVADDCSTDGTEQILVSLAKQQPRLRVLTGTKNLGVQRNLRRALGTARGIYVALLEGDDYWTDTSKLRVQATYLGAHPLSAGVAHLTRVIGDGVDSAAFLADYPGRNFFTREEVLLGTLPHLSSLMFRRSLLPTTPLWFDSFQGCDWLMSCLLTQQGDIGLIRRVMSTYRQNDQSSWTPLPFAERRTEILRQKLAVRRNVPNSFSVLTSAALTRHYGIAFSALARSDVRKMISLGAAIWKDDPRETSRQLVRWVLTRASARLRRHIRRLRLRTRPRDKDRVGDSESWP